MRIQILILGFKGLISLFSLHLICTYLLDKRSNALVMKTLLLNKTSAEIYGANV